MAEKPYSSSSGVGMAAPQVVHDSADQFEPHLRCKFDFVLQVAGQKLHEQIRELSVLLMKICVSAMLLGSSCSLLSQDIEQD